MLPEPMSSLFQTLRTFISMQGDLQLIHPALYIDCGGVCCKQQPGACIKRYRYDRRCCHWIAASDHLTDGEFFSLSLLGRPDCRFSPICPPLYYVVEASRVLAAELFGMERFFWHLPSCFLCLQLHLTGRLLFIRKRSHRG